MQILVTLKNVRHSESVAISNDPTWRESQRTDENTFAYNWAQLNHIQQLYGKTVGIIGFGEIGAELARRLQGWNCTLLYHKRRQLPASIEDELRIQYTDTQSIFQQSDVVVNLLPYFPETDMLINGNIINQMKSNSLLVSVGSGSVIDEVALADAVSSGHLAGVALDTFEYEPLRADNALRQLALDGYNVLLTPHTAAVGQHDAGRKADYAYIMQYLQGNLR
jgi:lactate dehydrogenase-like 2-hydroxyacid dehydrogenase